MQDSIALNAAQRSKVQLWMKHSTAQHSAAQHSTAQHSTAEIALWCNIAADHTDNQAVLGHQSESGICQVSTKLVIYKHDVLECVLHKHGMCTSQHPTNEVNTSDTALHDVSQELSAFSKSAYCS